MYNISTENQNSILKEYMTIGESAEYLGVSAMTLRRWDKSGKLKARRHPMNRYRLYTKTELDNVMNRIESSEKGNR